VLRLLLGELAPVAGTVRLGSNVEEAAFAQHQAEMLDDSRTVVAEFKTAVGERLGKHLRTTLGSFGFGGDAADRLVGVLSGGERTRLALAKIMVAPANLLVLDEPTNHLDLPSCDILEDALSVWPGTVLLVTHDRHLIRSVATDLIEVRGGTARWHHGVDERVLSPPVAPSLGSRRQPAEAPRSGAGLSHGEGKRAEAEHRNRRHRETKDLKAAVRDAERRWERAEAEVAEVQRLMADNAVYDDPALVRELGARHDGAKEEATAAMAEWEQAATRLERIEARLEAEAP
jgi:ATP-binding cassette subfamily F protein 3